MMLASGHTALFASICLAAIIGMNFRPWKIAPWIWACAASAALIGFGFLSFPNAGRAIVESLDVAAFLIGMMLIAEYARACGFFSWIAEEAAALAQGSKTRLFFWCILPVWL